MYIHIHVHIYIHLCVYIYIYIYIHTYTHIHTRAWIVAENTGSVAASLARPASKRIDSSANSSIN